MGLPLWFGSAPPSIYQMVDEAKAHDVDLHIDAYPGACLSRHSDGSPHAILIPARWGRMAKSWAILHELGHLHVGIDESLADRWAAYAMLPPSIVRAPSSRWACIHALRIHWQDFEEKMTDPIYRLAKIIADARLTRKVKKIS